MNAAEVLEVRLWLGAVADTAQADGKFGLRDMANRALALIDDLRAERDSLAAALTDTGRDAQDAEAEAYDHWCAMQDMGR